MDQELGTLSCQLARRRSGDMFLGDLSMVSSCISTFLAKLTGYKPGKLRHVIGDMHIYEEHYTSVKTQLKRSRNRFQH